DGAKGVLFNITVGKDSGMYEVDDAAKYITKAADPEARIIFVAVIDEELEEEVKITVIDTGFDESLQKPPPPVVRIEEPEPEPVKRPVYAPKVLEEEPEPEPVMDESDQDELEIPAFIRKKIK